MVRAQSELLSAVILTTLTVVIGAAAFYLSNSWAMQMKSETDFRNYGDLSYAEFSVYPTSVTNTGSSLVVYIGVSRNSINPNNYTLWVSAYYSTLSTQTPLWWTQTPLQQSQILYAVQPLGSGNYSLSFSQASNPVSVPTSKAWMKYANGWWTLRDLGAASNPTAYGVGILAQNQILVLSLTVPGTNVKYVYVILWVMWGDRYIAMPTPIQIS